MDDGVVAKRRVRAGPKARTAQQTRKPVGTRMYIPRYGISEHHRKCHPEVECWKIYMTTARGCHSGLSQLPAQLSGTKLLYSCYNNLP
jgi:hypothetical protein